MDMIGHATCGENFYFMGPSYTAEIWIKTRGEFGRNDVLAFLSAEDAMEQLI
jgi:hypothetical protein